MFIELNQFLSQKQNILTQIRVKILEQRPVVIVLSFQTCFFLCFG